MKLLVVLLLLVSCGKQVKTKYVENSYDDSVNVAKILELESKLEANDETINNLTTSMSELEGNNSDMSKLIEELREQNVKLLDQIKKLKCKKK